MQNPFVQKVAQELRRFELDDAVLLRQSYDHKSFGNAEALYSLGNLRLRFVRDRGEEWLSIASDLRPEKDYDFQLIAVVMGWISLEELVNYGSRINFNKAPAEPMFSLTKMVGFIARDLKRLDSAFSGSEILITHKKLIGLERGRCISLDVRQDVSSDGVFDEPLPTGSRGHSAGQSPGGA